MNKFNFQEGNGSQVKGPGYCSVLYQSIRKTGTIGCLILLHDNLFQSLRESFHNLPDSKGIQPLH